MAIDLNDVPVIAIRAASGIGKTTMLRAQFAKEIAAGRKPSLSVPTHALAEEVVVACRQEDGIIAWGYRGREAQDVERPDDKMCLEMPRVDRILSALAKVPEHACKSKGATCQHYGDCGYLRQRSKKPEVPVIVHAMLFAERPKDSMPDEPDSLAIDESFYKFGLRGFGRDDYRLLFLRDLLDGSREFRRRRKTKRRLSSDMTTGDEADLRAISFKVHNVLMAEPRGHQVSREALVRAGLTVDDAANAHKLELARIIELDNVLPGMPYHLVEQRTDAIAAHNQLAKRLADFWDLIRRTLERDDIERSLWLRLVDVVDPDSKTGQISPAVYLRWCRPIHPDWLGIPTVIVDATLSELITRAFFPNVKIKPTGRVKLPHVRIRQVTDSSFSAAMMIPRGGDLNDPHEKARSTMSGGCGISSTSGPARSRPAAYW